MVEISKSSKLYKFYDLLTYIPIINWFISYKYDDYHRKEINAFRDICSFIRQTMLALCIGVPIILMLIFLIIRWFIYFPISDGIFNNNEYAMVFIQAYAGLVIGYIILVIKERLDFGRYEVAMLIRKIRPKNNRIDSSTVKSEPGLIRQFSSVIKEKHDNMCKILKVKD